MELNNCTKMEANYTTFTDKTGREHLVVVIKGTYGIPLRSMDQPELLPKQVPLVTCDEFSGEPDSSAPMYEMEFVPRKPRCDVLLHGSAYAPGGKPADRVTVVLQVGSLTKSFDVVGQRTWKAGALYQGPGGITPFVKQSISYNIAFGGVDRTNPDITKHRWYLPNHAGVGYYVTSDFKAIDGKSMPQTEETGRPITNPNGSYRPMSFGPVARAWQPRPKWAGTYDQKWLNETAPFLPHDFDHQFFQTAPADQQIAYPSGGEQITLTNLTPQGRTAFTLPFLGLPVVFVPKKADAQEVPALVDTVILEPDVRRFMLIWRASVPVRRNLFEMRLAVVGKTAIQWQEDETRTERAQRKRRFPSLSALAKWARQTADENDFDND